MSLICTPGVIHAQSGNAPAAGAAGLNQSLSGMWRDPSGGEIEIVQTGAQIVATGKSESVTRWWDRATATLNGRTLTITFSLAGQPTDTASGTVLDANRIQWGNDSVWQRQGAAAPAADVVDLEKNLSGMWRDPSGGEIEIVQNGAQIVATGKSESITRWWDRATATLNGRALTMTHSLAGSITDKVSGTVQDANHIQWENGSSWQRHGAAAPAAAPVVANRSVLRRDESLRVGDSLVSDNGKYQLMVMNNGNVDISQVFGPESSNTIWESGAKGTASVSAELVMQGDGNLVVNANGTPIWATMSNKPDELNQAGGQCYAKLQDTGTLGVYYGAPGGANPRRMWLSTSQSVLKMNGTLALGQALKSNNGKYQLMQFGDGRIFVARNPGLVPLWTIQGPAGATQLSMLADGNLVAYANGHAFWAAGSNHPGELNKAGGECFAKLEDEGNLAVYFGTPDAQISAPMWSTPADPAVRPGEIQIVNRSGSSWVYLDKNTKYQLHSPGGSEIKIHDARGNVVVEGAGRLDFQPPDYHPRGEYTSQGNKTLLRPYEIRTTKTYDVVITPPPARFHCDTDLIRAADAALLQAYGFSAGQPPETTGILTGPAQITYWHEVGQFALNFFVASNDDTMIVAFRGSNNKLNWWMNGSRKRDGTEEPDHEYMWYSAYSTNPGFPNVWTHLGWTTGTKTIFDALKAEMTKQNASKKKVIITGHSMGGAMAGHVAYRLMNETDLLSAKFNGAPAGHKLVTFAAPRYAGADAGGNLSFKKAFDKLAKDHSLTAYGIEMDGDGTPRSWSDEKSCGHIQVHRLGKHINLSTAEADKHKSGNIYDAFVAGAQRTERIFIHSARCHASSDGGLYPADEIYVQLSNGERYPEYGAHTDMDGGESFEIKMESSFWGGKVGIVLMEEDDGFKVNPDDVLGAIEVPATAAKGEKSAAMNGDGGKYTLYYSVR